MLLASQGDTNNAKARHQPVREQVSPKKSVGRWAAIHPIRLAAEQQRLPVNSYMAKRVYIKDKVWTFHEQLGKSRDDRVPRAMSNPPLGNRKIREFVDSFQHPCR